MALLHGPISDKRDIVTDHKRECAIIKKIKRDHSRKGKYSFAQIAN